MISQIRRARVGNFSCLALRVLIYLIVLSGCAAFTTPSANAQQDYLQKLGRPSADTSMPVQNGAINLANGNLHIEIPMASLPAYHGKSVPVKLVYDSRLWTTLFSPGAEGYYPATPYNALGGWRVVQDNVGALTPCNNTIYRVFCDVGPTQTPSYGQCTYDSIHYHDYVYHSGFSWTGPNGETKTFTNLSTLQTDQTPTGACQGPDTPNADSYDDQGTGYHIFVTNYDNMVVYDNNGNLDYASSYLGQPVVTQSGNLMYFDFPNATCPTCTSRFTLTTTTINVSTAFGAPYTAEFSGPITVVQSLQLPNGQTYTFGYDSGTTPGHFGSLTSMTLPTGAEVQYGYSQFIDANCGFNVWATSYTSQGNVWSAGPSVTTPGTLCGYFDQTVGSGQHVDVYRPDGSHSLYQFATPDRVTIYNTTTQHFDTTGALLETDLKEYYTSITFPSRITTTLSTSSGGSISKKIEYDYDSPYWNNVSEVREWDWSASSPTRVTHALYSAAAPTYLAANVLNLPTSVVVKDGSGSVVAQTAYTYDTPINGNLIQESRWLNTGNTWLNTSYTYDGIGNRLTKTDPNDNPPTTYSYTDNFSDGVNPGTNAFLTKVTYPPVNGVNHIERWQYDYNTGLQTAACGENFSTSTTCARGLGAPQSDYTTHTYDEMGRLTGTIRGDGGQDSLTYDDTVPPFSQTTSTKIDPSHNLVSTAIFDSLGRTSQTQITSGPLIVYADTTYDSMGRVSTVSNPHFFTRSPTDGITTTAYDGLGRVTVVTAPDGSQTVTSYSGNSTTVVDPATNQRRSFTDGLGRLIEVDEPATSGGATSGSGSATASGTEQNIPAGSGTAGHGTVTIGGSDQSIQVEQDPTCTLYDDDSGNCLQWSNGSRDGSPTFVTVYDSGSVAITVNGHTKSAGYSSSSSALSIASALASFINGDSTFPATASASGAVVTLTSRTTGAATDYSLSSSSSTSDPGDFGSPSFGGSPSGSTLVGGTDGTGSATYDSGTVWITVNGHTDSVDYGQSSTASSLAASLATAIDADSGAEVTAAASGAAVTLVAKNAGSNSNYSLTSGASTSQSGTFSSPSFSISVSGPSLTGGSTPDVFTSSNVTRYSYDALDNLTCVVQKGTDTTAFTNCASASATWRPRTYVYDSLSRMTSVTNPESGTISYTHDADGNLLTQTDARGIVTTNQYDALDRIRQKTYSDGTTAASFIYDVPIAWGPQITNVIGRLSYSGAGLAESIFSYDPMGRTNLNYQCTPYNCGWAAFPLTYTYDFAGELTQLNYPSGRVVTFQHDGAEHLTNVNFASFNGQAVNYNYLASASYAPTGAPTGLLLGNGLAESTSYNPRLQPVTSQVWSVAVTALNHSYNFTDASGHNNGNVASVTDNLQPNRTQSFTYDSLNRLASAQTQVSSGPDCWGEGYGYDAWGNLLSASPTRCAGPSLSVGVYTNNRITNPGITYDASGNMTSDAVHTYTYDAESRLTKVDGGSTATYIYDAEGQRVQKTAGGVATDYIYSEGSPIAEFTPSTGGFSDYISANGRMLARADSFDYRLHIWGTNCSSCGWQYVWFNLPSAAGLGGYVIQNSDKLLLRQWQSGSAQGGIALQFSDGSGTYWSATDQDGIQANSDSQSNSWHYRRIDLSAFAGKTVSQVEVGADGNTGPGDWGIYFNDVVLLSADGTVHPIYEKVSSAGGMTSWGSGGMTGLGSEANLFTGAAIDPGESTTYYHADHLGSARSISAHGGWPVWSATYLPFGQEWNPQSTVNHYKFTGKEHDAESGLDDFLARYYGNSLGRFLSADAPLAGQHADDPQSWNLYSYVRNNPLVSTDPDGHDCIVVGGGNTRPLPGKCPGDSGGKEFQVDGTVTEHHYNPKTDSEDFTYTPDGADPKSISVVSGTITNVTSIQDQVAFDNNRAAIAIVSQLNQMRKPMMQSIGYFAGGSAAIGMGGGALCFYFCPEAATLTLAGETGTDLIDSTNTLNKIIGNNQRELLKQFFKSEQRPQGLSARTLKIYRTIAQRAIDAGQDQAGVQAKRLQMILNALK